MLGATGNQVIAKKTHKDVNMGSLRNDGQSPGHTTLFEVRDHHRLFSSNVILYTPVLAPPSVTLMVDVAPYQSRVAGPKLIPAQRYWSAFRPRIASTSVTLIPNSI